MSGFLFQLDHRVAWLYIECVYNIQDCGTAHAETKLTSDTTRPNKVRTNGCAPGNLRGLPSGTVAGHGHLWFVSSGTAERPRDESVDGTAADAAANYSHIP